MAAHHFDTSLSFPQNTDAYSEEEESVFQTGPGLRVIDDGLGAARGVAFGLLLEFSLVCLGLGGWELWRMLH